MAQHRAGDLLLRNNSGSCRVDQHGHGTRHADGIRHLHLTAVGKPCRHDILRHVAGGVGSRAIHLGRILAGKGAAAMPGIAAVGVHDDLASRQARVPGGTADNEPSGRIDIYFGLLIQQGAGHRRQNDAVYHILPDNGKLCIRAVLSRNDNGIHPRRNAVAVLHRHLRFSVRAQVVHPAGLAQCRQPLGKRVGKRDRQRHQLRRLVAGVAEHQPLIARTYIQPVARAFLCLQRAVNAHRNVRRLLMDGGNDRAAVAVKTEFRPRIADLAHSIAHDLLQVNVRVRRDLAHDGNQPRRAECLARHARQGILAEHLVQDRIGNDVADLVGMPLGHGLTGKKLFFHECIFPFLILSYLCLFCLWGHL